MRHIQRSRTPLRSEYRRDGEKVYTIEAVDVDAYQKKNSAGQLVAFADCERQTPIAEYVSIIAKSVAEFNGENIRFSTAKRLDEERKAIEAKGGTVRFSTVGEKESSAQGPLSGSDQIQPVQFSGGATSHALTPESADPVRKFARSISQNGAESPAGFLVGLFKGREAGTETGGRSSTRRCLSPSGRGTPPPSRIELLETHRGTDSSRRFSVVSVDTVTDEDFRNPSRDVTLPPLPNDLNRAIGGEGKPVLIKKNIFEKNLANHPEITPDESREILDLALYHADIAGQTQPKKREHYWVAVNRGNNKNATVVVDVYPTKDNIEVVGWRNINDKGLEKLKRQAEREDGQLLILSPDTGSAAALSALTPGLSSTTDSIAKSVAEFNGENLRFSTAKRLDEERKAIEAKGGELLLAHHGTDSRGFTRFEKSDDIGYFFAKSRKTAASYIRRGQRGDEEKPGVPYYTDVLTYLNDEASGYTPEEVEAMSYEEKVRAYVEGTGEESGVYDVALKMEDPYRIDCHGANWDAIYDVTTDPEATTYDIVKVEYDPTLEEIELHTREYGESEETVEKFKGLVDFIRAFKERFGDEFQPDLQEIEKAYSDNEDYATFEIVDGRPEKGATGAVFSYRAMDGEGWWTEAKKTRDIVEDAANMGCDGVIFYNVVDNGGGIREADADDVYVVMKSEQVKSVDSMTYADDGSIIPAEKRFDWSNPDIRYSTSGLYTGSAADYANKDKDGRIVNPPSLLKIGTGEGSQVYGWGLYGTTLRKNAERDIYDKRMKNLYEQTFFTDRERGDESRLLDWDGQATLDQKKRLRRKPTRSLALAGR